MVFVEADDYRALRRPGDDPAQFRSPVRPAQVPVAPDSVVHQYRGENFTTSGWTDSVGNADMSITGVSASTLNGDRSASADGVDDVGLADGPQDLPENETFGVAMVFNDSSKANSSSFFSVNDNGAVFEVLDSNFRDSSLGELFVTLLDNNGNIISVETTKQFINGQTNIMVLEKLNNTASGISIYINDMSSPVSTVNHVSQNFDHNNYSVNLDMGFFARSANSGVDRFNETDISFIEFNEQPYSQQDRLELKQRAPGL
jgi:hypothetical protein